MWCCAERSRTIPTIRSQSAASIAWSRRGNRCIFTLQNIAEFWNVATRPAEHNGLGFTVAMVRAQIELIEATLELLPDTPAIYEEWKRLVTRYGVMGAKVHDARLVAAMNVHEVTRLLTFNAGAFVQYALAGGAALVSARRLGVSTKVPIPSVIGVSPSSVLAELVRAAFRRRRPMPRFVSACPGEQRPIGESPAQYNLQHPPGTVRDSSGRQFLPLYVRQSGSAARRKSADL
jgi:predicted nucleic acid-binding protein